ncbi:hypothetical protein DEAC_c39480 [Desulfosporosinus acididurans]|uniref:Uncharacterized protein n=1 Tax=Desulfosporosinus acididurans TaxID=476652 RepID=A0A0J1FME5_9FIRM|nr:DUF5320 domain-containing protein [Desulfosporosinus acididurans]KLU64133.1 hypothetical protein DEAC_c39480 [Desulfosporosinus acididurans]
MPGRDGSGPRGRGAANGKGFSVCSGDNVNVRRRGNGVGQRQAQCQGQVQGQGRGCRRGLGRALTTAASVNY